MGICVISVPVQASNYKYHWQCVREIMWSQQRRLLLPDVVRYIQRCQRHQRLRSYRAASWRTCHWYCYWHRGTEASDHDRHGSLPQSQGPAKSSDNIPQTVITKQHKDDKQCDWSSLMYEAISSGWLQSAATTTHVIFFIVKCSIVRFLCTMRVYSNSGIIPIT